MESQQQINRRYRLNRIVDLCKGEGLTMNDIAAKLDMNYFTIRKDILELAETHRVHQAGLVKGGAILYRSGPLNKLPVLFNIKSGGYQDILEYAEVWVQRNFPETASVKAAKDLMPMHVEIMKLVYNAKATSPAEQEIARTGLLKLAIANQESAKALESFWSQIVKLPVLSEDGLATFLQTTTLPDDRVEKLVANYNAKLAARKTAQLTKETTESDAAETGVPTQN